MGGAHPRGAGVRGDKPLAQPHPLIPAAPAAPCSIARHWAQAPACSAANMASARPSRTKPKPGNEVAKRRQSQLSLAHPECHGKMILVSTFKRKKSQWSSWGGWHHRSRTVV